MGVGVTLPVFTSSRHTVFTYVLLPGGEAPNTEYIAYIARELDLNGINGLQAGQGYTP